jgi:hypothetical protein
MSNLLQSSFEWEFYVDASIILGDRIISGYLQNIDFYLWITN